MSGFARANLIGRTDQRDHPALATDLYDEVTYAGAYDGYGTGVYRNPLGDITPVRFRTGPADIQ